MSTDTAVDFFAISGIDLRDRLNLLHKDWPNIAPVDMKREEEIRMNTLEEKKKQETEPKPLDRDENT